MLAMLLCRYFCFGTAVNSPFYLLTQFSVFIQNLNVTPSML